MIAELSILLSLNRDPSSVPDLVLRTRRRDLVNGTTAESKIVGAVAKTGATVTSTTVFSALEQRIRSGLEDVLASAKHKSVAALAEQVVAAMAATVMNEGLLNVPPMVASEDEDGTIFIEWIFADRRVGLTFDREQSQSGWHFVTGKGEQAHVIFGKLNQLEPADLTRMALSRC